MKIKIQGTVVDDKGREAKADVWLNVYEESTGDDDVLHLYGDAYIWEAKVQPTAEWSSAEPKSASQKDE